jgi:hypothetical protein
MEILRYMTDEVRGKWRKWHNKKMDDMDVGNKEGKR